MTALKACIIGGGLAGCEAAWQLATQNIEVDLWEMRPERKTGAHHSDRLAELVCSNSLGSYGTHSASALLKEEMKLLRSKILEIALNCQVPAGNALGVDRERFAETVTQEITGHPRINLRRNECPEIPNDAVVIISSGPLTSASLSQSISSLTGQESLHFFDAASPILTYESIDMEKAYAKNRYAEGEGAYINCPLTKEEYENFWQALIEGERAELKDFEKNTPYFEACLPVEVIASRGKDTLRFGPMKPVGLEDPRTGKRPYAAVQLRQDNAAANLYNIVGFQTNLKWGAQKQIFKMIPALENAEFVRFGVMHRNTYLNSPLVLNRTLNLRKRENVFFAGQLTGVEGYTESAAVGLIAGLNAARYLRGEPLFEIKSDTMIGALIRYITSADAKHFQPINSNWGIIDCPEALMKLDKRSRQEHLAKQALASISQYAICRAQS